MTNRYQGLGVVLAYPENWQLTEDFEGNSVIGFQLQSPTSAFMAVFRYPWTTPPTEALAEVQLAIAAEYDDVESLPIAPPAVLDALDALMDCRALELNFYYLDLLVHIRLVAFCTPQWTYLIQFQAEDRDFNQLDRVFDALLFSLAQSIQHAPLEASPPFPIVNEDEELKIPNQDPADPDDELRESPSRREHRDA